MLRIALCVLLLPLSVVLGVFNCSQAHNASSCPIPQCLWMDNYKYPHQCVTRLSPIDALCKDPSLENIQCGRGVGMPSGDDGCNCCPFYDSPFLKQGHGDGGKGAWGCDPRLLFCGDAEGEFTASSPCGYGMHYNGTCHCCDTFSLDPSTGKCLQPKCDWYFGGFLTERCAKGFVNTSGACECCHGYTLGTDGRCVVAAVNGSASTAVVVATSRAGDSFNSHHTPCYQQSRGDPVNVSGGSNCLQPTGLYGISCSDSYTDPSLFNMSFSRESTPYCTSTSALPVGKQCVGQKENLEPNKACREGSFDIYSFCKGSGHCSNNDTKTCNFENDVECWSGGGYCKGSGHCDELPCTVDCTATCGLAAMVPVPHTHHGQDVAGTSIICQHGYDFKTFGCVCEMKQI